MTRVEIRSLTEADLPAAGRLLAERHRLHRSAQPFLPSRYEDSGFAEAEVVAAWKNDGASGAVACRGDEVVGFLLGAPKTSPLWGPNVWVEAAGQAVDEAEVMRDLYAVAATRWVADGRTAHYVLVPTHDEALVRAWFRLGFGQQHAHAVRDVPTDRPVVPSGIEVRPARREDIPTLARLDLELPRHQGLAPTFSAGELGSLEESLEEWEEDFGSEDMGVFVAVRDGEVVGSAVGCPVEKSSAHAGLARPENAALLAFAAVFPAARGLGAGRALGEAVLGWSADRGFDCVVTDWRTTNLLSSRAWPALGFEPTFLRLHRMLGY
jgi:GNAT superfamily N-acetyltransferase